MRSCAALATCWMPPPSPPLPDSLKVIGTFSVGHDHIDLAVAKARGIRICHTPDVLSVATAECAMLLILAAARRAGEGERLVRSGTWQGWAPTQLLGTQVSGRRLGIFGMGRIGREIARMARGFEMEIHYRDMTRLPPDQEQGAIFHDADAGFLQVCEVLSLNAPGGGDTRHWLNAERIGLLPAGAVVVNAARGTLVDDDALIAALRGGHVAAAGLDVYNDEPRVHPEYLKLDNVVLLPHLGSATTETREAMGRSVLAGIGAVLAGATTVEPCAMTPRIAVGGFLHESHSFAPRPTTYADFLRPGGLPPFSAGAGLLDAMRPRSVPLAGAIAVAEAEGANLVPLAWGFANPAGPVQDEAFERIAARICAPLSVALDEAKLDVVYLDLHDAAVAESFPDAEGELLRRVRAIVGDDLPLTVSLDPHANLTE